MSIRVVVTGPESSGKTTLTQKLCSYFQAEYVGEYARVYIGRLDRPYALADLEHIAAGQRRWEKAALSLQKKLVIQDTDFLTIRIWYEYKYSIIKDDIERELIDFLPDLYLLCQPDIPWTFDPQRENQHDRDVLYNKYQNAIQKLNVPFTVIDGDFSKRMQTAITAVQEIL